MTPLSQPKVPEDAAATGPGEGRVACALALAEELRVAAPGLKAGLEALTALLGPLRSLTRHCTTASCVSTIVLEKARSYSRERVVTSQSNEQQQH